MYAGTRQSRLTMGLISEIRIYFLNRRVKSLKIYFELSVARLLPNMKVSSSP